MDHHEQHHQHHQKEREEKKKEQQEHEREEDQNMPPVRPAWLLGFGVVLVLTAVLIWTIFLR